LHFHDIDLLLKVLHRLRDHGNTVVVIEHNLDVIKTADWVIDLGPGGGVNGGRIVVEGTPETVASTKASFTGQYLKPLLERASVKPTVVETKPKRPARSRRTSAADEDELGLVVAK
jgi:excinuclease ABC subunit A